ncbi:hypothetical protein B0H17DRAFT_303361 [Mycena rosella]|uniref:Uncharacterized protein n=1 Tax=Mycena rosella TaxID=1033263 RepID=A0AAD7CUE6_MYCRO|nr:hypothetical protein B0H17DRAFT_303361 [Mycena rosella]
MEGRSTEGAQSLHGVLIARRTSLLCVCDTRRYALACPTAQPSSRSRSAAASVLRPALNPRRCAPARHVLLLPAEIVKRKARANPRSSWAASARSGTHSVQAQRAARSFPQIRCAIPRFVVAQYPSYLIYHAVPDASIPRTLQATAPTQTALHLRTSALSLQATPACPTTSGGVALRASNGACPALIPRLRTRHVTEEAHERRLACRARRAPWLREWSCGRGLRPVCARRRTLLRLSPAAAARYSAGCACRRTSGRPGIDVHPKEGAVPAGGGRRECGCTGPTLSSLKPAVPT